MKKMCIVGDGMTEGDVGEIFRLKLEFLEQTIEDRCDGRTGAT
jgi:hypothetical protein